MRPVLWAAAAAMLVVATACQKASENNAPGAPAAATAAQVEATSTGGPKRADGYWQSTLGDTKGPFYCVGDGSEEKWSLVDDLSVLGTCSKKDFQRMPGGWTFETVCAADGVTSVQKGTITGDFRTGYVIDQTVTQTPGSSVKGRIVAQRVGDCPSDVKPGDKVVNGLSFNLLHSRAP